MPLFLQLDRPRLAVWQIAEPEAFFLERLNLSAHWRDELAECHPSRRVEWLASRYLATLLTGQNPFRYRKDEQGKPWLLDEAGHVSFSHTPNYAAVLVADYPAGVDIQALDEKTLRIRNKFMRPEELAALDPLSPEYAPTVHVHWCVREAVYKAYGLRGLDFRAHIRLSPFIYGPGRGTFAAMAQKGNMEQHYTAHYQALPGAMLVYVVGS